MSAPRCIGSHGGQHAPIHCKHRGYAFISGLRHVKFVCPRCHKIQFVVYTGRHFRAKRNAAFHLGEALHDFLHGR